MQTFLPYASFAESARALDTKRLGKQRVEVIQIVRALTVPGYAWSQHPATLMWKGFEEALGRYGLAMCEAWRERGFDDTCAETIATDLRTAGIEAIRSEAELTRAGDLPAWLTDEAFQRSHQSSLVRKDPDFYRERFPTVPDDIDYVWPVRSEAVIERERRREEAARQRERRAAEKLLADELKAKRRRSAAAKKGWANRVKRAQDQLRA